MANVELDSVIEDAVTDAGIGTEDDFKSNLSDLDTPTTETVEAAPETEAEPVEAAAEEADPSESEVASPAAKAPETPVDDKFAKEFGINPQMVGGRENRIPYSRVKSIVAKAQEKALAPVTKELDEYKTKVTDYETKFKDVAQFENIMVNDAPRFLGMLETLPAYKDFFTQVRAALNPQQQEAAAAVPEPTDGMPEPDQKLQDGTLVYSPDGQKKLIGWLTKQVEDRVTNQVAKRYEPIEKAWETQEYMNRVIPQVQAQIDAARKWPMFVDNEKDIVAILKEDPNVSLEGAYQRVVFPKLMASKDQIRQQVLQEVKAAPHASTSVSTSASRPSPAAGATGRSIESIIEDSIRSSGLAGQ